MSCLFTNPNGAEENISEYISSTLLLSQRKLQKLEGNLQIPVFLGLVWVLCGLGWDAIGRVEFHFLLFAHESCVRHPTDPLLHDGLSSPNAFLLVDHTGTTAHVHGKENHAYDNHHLNRDTLEEKNEHFQ